MFAFQQIVHNFYLPWPFWHCMISLIRVLKNQLSLQQDVDFAKKNNFSQLKLWFDKPAYDITFSWGIFTYFLSSWQTIFLGLISFWANVLKQKCFAWDETEHLQNLNYSLSYFQKMKSWNFYAFESLHRKACAKILPVLFCTATTIFGLVEILWSFQN